MTEHVDNSVDVEPAATEDRPDRMRVTVRSENERDVPAFIDGVELEQKIIDARAVRDAG